MALFGKNKTDTKIKTQALKTVESDSLASKISSMAQTIVRPRITEKSGILSQGNTYTFEITKGANKNSVFTAIKSLYKVIPAKIAIINIPAKKVLVRGRKGVTSGVRKALVTLKKGDKIDFV